jgi:hypothetical protein
MMSAGNHEEQSPPPATAVKPAPALQPSDRELYAKTFDDLSKEAEDSITFATKAVKRFKLTLGACKSADELRTKVEPCTLASLQRSGQTFEQILTQPDKAASVFTENRVEECFIDHMPEAARHVMDAIIRKLLKAPRNVWRQLTSPTEPIPTEDDELRGFWRRQILPGLKDEYAARFSYSADKAWNKARDNAEACALLAELIRAGDTKALTPITNAHDESSTGNMPEQDMVKTFSVMELRKLSGFGNATLHKYTKDAKIPTAGRGKRNHRFTMEQAKHILETIIKLSNQAQVRENCQKSLDNLNSTA